ncbi:MAG: AI-2E family transporter [Cyanobacteriota bacterium]|nr:AI-2E family transporter [Cyanobacteriota bacterium]
MKPTRALLQWFILGLLFPLFFLNGWLLIIVFQYFQSLIYVVAAATLLSFLLDYPVRHLERYRIQRSVAILFVFFGISLLLVILGITLFPIITNQFNTFLKQLPSWLDSASAQLISWEMLASRLGISLDFNQIASQFSEILSSQSQNWGGYFWGGVVLALTQTISSIFTLVLTFYMLLNGEQFWNGLFQFLPLKIRDRVRHSLSQNFHNYFIGQGTLAGLIGLTATLTFLIFDVPFGLLFGLTVGAMALFPFGGVIGICLVSLFVALNDVWLGIRVWAIAIALEQAVENAIAPRLFSGFTGINPVWILISLLIGAKLAGLLGLIVAVPTAGFIKSLVELFGAETISSLDSPDATTRSEDETSKL